MGAQHSMVGLICRSYWEKILELPLEILPSGYKGDFTKFLSPEDLKRLPSTPEAYQETRIQMWEALQDLKKEGKIRDIGVSNFNRFHIEQLIKNPR